MFFSTFGAYRKHTLGSEDYYYYYNPLTGRKLKTKNVFKYNKVVLYSYNERLGYQGLALLERIPDKGIMVLNEVFDQSENIPFNDLWDLLLMDQKL